MPGYTYETLCPNCGETVTVPNVFCDRKCWKEYQDKKRIEQERRRAKCRGYQSSRPLVPEDLCMNCKYSQKYSQLVGCGYFFIKGETRLAKHPEGLTAECQEFEPRKTPRRRRQQNGTGTA